MTSQPDLVVSDRPLASKVEALVGFGIPAADIAIVLQTDEPSLRRDYADEIAGGEIKANARVAECLFRKATGEGRESVTAAIFWLKTRARWKETSIHELSGHDGGPIGTHSNTDLAKAILLVLNGAGGAMADAQNDLQLRMAGPDAP